MLLEIAGNNVTQMTHRDALELIQRCSNALFLTVHKYESFSPLFRCRFFDGLF